MNWGATWWKSSFKKYDIWAIVFFIATNYGSSLSNLAYEVNILKSLSVTSWTICKNWFLFSETAVIIIPIDSIVLAFKFFCYGVLLSTLFNILIIKGINESKYFEN